MNVSQIVDFAYGARRWVVNADDITPVNTVRLCVMVRDGLGGPPIRCDYIPRTRELRGALPERVAQVLAQQIAIHRRQQGQERMKDGLARGRAAARKRRNGAYCSASGPSQWRRSDE